MQNDTKFLLSIAYALDVKNNFNVKRSELNRSLNNKLEQRRSRDRDEKDPQREKKRQKLSKPQNSSKKQ